VFSGSVTRAHLASRTLVKEGALMFWAAVYQNYNTTLQYRDALTKLNVVVRNAAEEARFF
jgi:hypothetical protein